MVSITRRETGQTARGGASGGGSHLTRAGTSAIWHHDGSTDCVCFRSYESPSVLRSGFTTGTHPTVLYAHLYGGFLRESERWSVTGDGHRDSVTL